MMDAQGPYKYGIMMTALGRLQLEALGYVKHGDVPPPVEDLP
jgi:hypothetical protein